MLSLSEFSFLYFNMDSQQILVQVAYGSHLTKHRWSLGLSFQSQPFGLLSPKGYDGEGRDRILRPSPIPEKLFISNLFYRMFIGKLSCVLFLEKFKFCIVFSGALATKVETESW